MTYLITDLQDAGNVQEADENELFGMANDLWQDEEIELETVEQAIKAIEGCDYIVTKI